MNCKKFCKIDVLYQSCLILSWTYATTQPEVTELVSNNLKTEGAAPLEIEESHDIVSAPHP